MLPDFQPVLKNHQSEFYIILKILSYLMMLGSIEIFLFFSISGYWLSVIQNVNGSIKGTCNLARKGM